MNTIIDEHIRFDPDLYLMRNPDVAAANADPLDHWLRYGRDEERQGLRPSWLAPSFDEQGYKRDHADAVAAVAEGRFASGAEHWFAIGRDELRSGRRLPPANFDNAAYLAQRPDVAASIANGTFVDGYDHWLQWGAADARAKSMRYAAGSSFEGAGRFADAVPEEQARFWNENGFMVLRNAISPELCQAMSDRIDRLWIERRSSAPPISIDVYLERPDSRRIPMADAPGDARALPYKINDMFLVDETARALALHEGIIGALRWVLGADPAVIGSLNFERGSTQRFHTDTLYMPGKSVGGMTAAWIALEDVTPEAGPLLYYTGSHAIPLFRFSTGQPVQVNEEFGDYEAYMGRNVAERGLSPQSFLPKKGDVLIWHERLYHGGSPIEDMAQTRKSLVVHYWRAAEMASNELVANRGGFYWNRQPLA